MATSSHGATPLRRRSDLAGALESPRFEQARREILVVLVLAYPCLQRGGAFVLFGRKAQGLHQRIERARGVTQCVRGGFAPVRIASLFFQSNLLVRSGQ